MDAKKELAINDSTEISINAESLISQGIKKGLPVETMERLLAMRRELKAEADREAFFISLARFQKDCPVIAKTREVYDKSGLLKWKFAPIDIIVSTVQELLETCGFSYTVKTKQTETSVTAICEAHHIAGHTETTEFTIPIDPKAYMNAAQKVASALTYSKRYAFCNAFGIMSGDDDQDAEDLHPEKLNSEIEKPKVTDVTDRQKIINEIATVMKHDKFTDEDKEIVRNKIKFIKKNTMLKVLLHEWEEKLKDDFQDDPLPETKENISMVDKTPEELFQDDLNKAQEENDRKEAISENIY